VGENCYAFSLLRGEGRVREWTKKAENRQEGGGREKTNKAEG